MSSSKGSKLRINSLLIIILVIISSVLFLTLTPTNNTTNTGTKNVLSPESVGSPTWGDMATDWGRENVFLNYNIYLAQGGGTRIESENYNIFKYNPHPYIILMFGDSYTWGNGEDDFQSNIAVRLQDHLNSATKPNTFFVLPWAANGRNTYSFVDNFSGNRLKMFKADMAIYNYVFNDAIPNFNESLICTTINSCNNRYQPKVDPSYLSCLNGERGYMGKFISRLIKRVSATRGDNLLARYCQPLLNSLSKKAFDEEYLIRNPKKNPYYNTWLKAVSILKNEFGDTPLYVTDLKIGNVSKKVSKETENTFKINGYRVIKSPWLEDKLNKSNNGFMRYYNVNPRNAHYSYYFTDNIARDISSKILNDLGKNKIEEIVKSNHSTQDQSYNLLHSTMPFKVRVEKNNLDTAEITYNPADQDGLYKIKTGKTTYPFQGVNCLNIKHPNVIVNLDNHVTRNNFNKITATSSSPEIGVAYSYYDSQSLKHIETKNNANSISIDSIPGAKGYSLIFYDKKQGCPENSEINMKKFSAKIYLR